MNDEMGEKGGGWMEDEEMMTHLNSSIQQLNPLRNLQITPRSLIKRL